MLNSDHFFLFILTARAGSKALANLTPNERAQIIHQLAELIQDNHREILAANQKDMVAARRDGSMAASLVSRLELTSQKLNVLTEGLRQIAESSKNILGRPIRATRLGDGLDLHQITVPIGVLLVIFESRPDCLPQVTLFSLFEFVRFDIVKISSFPFIWQKFRGKSQNLSSNNKFYQTSGLFFEEDLV